MRRTWGAVVVCIALTGCSGPSSGIARMSFTPTTGSTLPAEVELVTTAGGSSGLAGVQGTVGVDARGCWTLATADGTLALVWPASTTWAKTTVPSVRVDGRVITIGDTVSGHGGYATDVTRSSVALPQESRCISGTTVSFVTLSSIAAG